MAGDCGVSLEGSIVQWSCGCAGLDIQRGGGDHFVLAACGKHKESHAHWHDFRGERFKHVDALMALCVLDGIAGLVQDGWKLRTVKDLLGVSR